MKKNSTTLQFRNSHLSSRMTCRKPRSFTRAAVLSLLAGLVIGQSAQATDGTWTTNGNGTWNDSANWSGSAVADGAGSTADFSTIDLTGSNATVTMDTTSRTVGTMLIGDSTVLTGTTADNRSYTIAASGGASLIFNNNGSTAVLTQIATSAANTISAPITLNDDLQITNSSTNSLTMSGAISGAKGVTISATNGIVYMNPTLISSGSADSGSTTYTLNTLANVYVGQTVSGTGIAVGTTVAAVSGSTVTLSLSSTAAVTNAVFSGSVYSGNTTISSGTVRVGQSSAFSGGAVLNGAFGTGSVTFADGVALATSGGGTIGASTFFINGNMNIGATGLTGRVVLGGPIDLNNGTRTLTLLRSSTAGSFTVSGLEAIQIAAQTNGPAITVSNGTLRFVADPSVTGSNYAAARFTSMSFTSNHSGLVIGNRVITEFGSGTTFSGGVEPRVTVESGGYFSMGDGATSRNVTIFSLSGSGTITNLAITSTTSGIATLTVSGTDTATFSGLITDGTSLNATLGTSAVGKVALTKSGSGTQILTGANNYTGTTTIGGGVLRAVDGVGLSSNSLLTINGGVFETSGNFVRTSGSAAGNVQLTGGVSGFSANGAPAVIAIGGTASPTSLVWGSATFNPSTLVLNGTTADNTIDFKNPIDLASAARTVNVNANTATISGVLSSSGTGALTKGGAGTLNLSASNTYTGGTTISGGVILIGNKNALSSGTITFSGGSLAASTPLTGANALAVSQIASSSNISVTGNNSIELSGSMIDIGSRTITNNISAGSSLLVSGPVYLSSGTSGFTLTGSGSGLTTISGVVSNSLTTGSTSQVKSAGPGVIELTNPSNTIGVTANAGIQATSGTLRLAPTGGSLTVNTQVQSGIGGVLQLAGDAANSNTFSSGLGNSQNKGTTLVSSGTWSLGSNNTITSDLKVEGGTLSTFTSDRLTLNGTGASGTIAFALSGGQIITGTSIGFRPGNNASGAAGANTASFAGTQTGGLFTINSGATGPGSGFALGGTSTGLTTSYLMSGGTTSVTGYLSLGADTGGSSTTTFTLNGGNLSVSRTISGLQSGAIQVFDFTGGKLNALTIDATNLRKTGDASNGTFTENGSSALLDVTGTNTTITGNFALLSGSAQIGSGRTLTVNGALTGLGVITGVTSGTGTLLVSSTSTSGTFGGKLQDGTGVLALTKSGSGTTLTLTGSNNSYSGKTTVNAGTLEFGASQTLTGGLTVATSGTAVLLAHSGGASNVRVLDISSLTISGTTPFIGGGGKDVQLFDSGFAASPAPVPEPGAWVMLLSGLGLLGALRRASRRE